MGQKIKNTGIVRRLDELGRITLPIELRRNLDLNEKAQSLKVYKSKYATPMAVRISKDKMGMTKDMLTLPMFSIWNL